MFMDKGNGDKKRTKSRGGKVIPISRTNAFAKLKAMKCFKEVHQNLIDGWPLTEVARLVQQDRKEYTDVSKDSLVATLQKYRATIPAAQMAKKALNPTQVQALAEVKDKLNVLDEMKKLYELQMERVGWDVDFERKMKKTLPGTTVQELRAAKEFLETYHKIEASLGVDPAEKGSSQGPAQTNLHVHIDATSNPGVQKVLESPDSRRKLLGFAQRLLSNAPHAASAKDADKKATPATVEVLPPDTKETE